MSGRRRGWGAAVGVAALTWGWALGVPWDLGRAAAAQDSPGDRAVATDSFSFSLRTLFLPKALKERLDEFVAMTPAQQAELMEHERLLAKLDPAKQERLRSLCQELHERPNAEELRKVMRRYYDWLTTLPPSVQAELAELPCQQRVARIQEMLAGQAKKAPKGPGPQATGWADPYRRAVLQYGGGRARFFHPDDMVGLLEWLDTYVAKRGSELLKEISSPAQREELGRQIAQMAAIKDTLHRHELVAALMLRWQLDHPGKMPKLEDSDLKQMQESLSETTRRQLQRQPVAEQWRDVSRLIALFVLVSWGPGGAHPQVSAVGDEELVQFFEKELSAKDRDWLLSLPGGEKRISRELLRTYIHRKLYQGSDQPPGLFGPWDKRGGPPGPRFGPGRGPEPKARAPETGQTGVQPKGAGEKPEARSQKTGDRRQKPEVESDKSKGKSATPPNPQSLVPGP